MTNKRSGTKTKSVGSARHGKPQVKRELKDLDARRGKQVRGGTYSKLNVVYTPQKPDGSI